MHKINLAVFVLIINAAACAVVHAEDTVPVVEGFSGEFELLDRHGELVRDDAFRGKNILLAFGFTHCVHVCPMIAIAASRSPSRPRRPVPFGLRNMRALLPDAADAFADVQSSSHPIPSQTAAGPRCRSVLRCGFSCRAIETNPGTIEVLPPPNE